MMSLEIAEPDPNVIRAIPARWPAVLMNSSKAAVS